MSFPMPNDKMLGGTCIASTWYREADEELPNNRYTVVVLMPDAPYYMTCVVEDQNDVLVPEWSETHYNIIPAINGEPARYIFGNEEIHAAKYGYVDMGGDY
jgi:hypothetical protein